MPGYPILWTIYDFSEVIIHTLLGFSTGLHKGYVFRCFLHLDLLIEILYYLYDYLAIQSIYRDYLEKVMFSMVDEVKTCVSARIDFFGRYMAVPPQLQPELMAFTEKINDLGESCSNAAEFEKQFQTSGLMDAFNGLITRCSPLAYQMTAEDNAKSRQVAKEIFREDKDRILKDAGEDLLESLEMKVESDVRAQRIHQMSEAGVLDNYTRATNLVEDVGILARLFRKKKK